VDGQVDREGDIRIDLMHRFGRTLSIAGFVECRAFLLTPGLSVIRALVAL